MEFTFKEYKCGCSIDTDNYGDFVIEYCPLHKAAPAMYEALKAITDTLENYCDTTVDDTGWGKNHRDVIQARKAIAKAEGKCLKEISGLNSLEHI